MSSNNLHSYWSSQHRNDLAENSICNKREKDAQRRHFLKESDAFHRQCDATATAYSVFEDGRPASSHNRRNRNEESLTDEIAKEVKDQQFNQRKARLSSFLHSEQDTLEQEAKAKRDSGRQTDPWNTKSMQEKLDELKKEKEVLQLAEKKVYQQREMNNLEADRVTQAKSQKDKRDMADYWGKQIQQKKEECREEQVRSTAFEAERQRGYERDVRQDEKQRQVKEMEKKVWLDGLKLQMEEGKDKEIEEKKLKEEEYKLMLFDQELQRIQEEQKKVQAGRNKRELSGMLDRQHKAKLRETAQEVQRQLEEDKKILDQVFGHESQTLIDESTRRQKLKSDVEWMKSIISEQMKLEKERQSEIQLLYDEEAEKMWQKREIEWQRERDARNKLMTELLDGLKNQVNEKITRNRDIIDATTKEGDTMRQNFGVQEKEMAKERLDHSATKERYKQDLLKQMSEDQHRKDDDEIERHASQPKPPQVMKPPPSMPWHHE